MTVYYPKHTDSLSLDYTIGTCLILFFLVSTTLNPLSFLYHIQRDSKLSSRLYALLALLDFIVNIYSPLFQAHNFFKETEDFEREVGVQTLILQGTTQFAAWSSQIVINVIICVRLYTIKYPFERVSQKLIWIIVVGAMLYVLVMESVTITAFEVWDPIIQLATVPVKDLHKSMDLLYTFTILVPISVIYILGGISSIYTVFLLTRDTGPSETREQKRKSVRIILTLTIVNWSAPIAIIYTNFKWPTENSTTAELVGVYVVVNGIKTIVSAFDPVIILTLSQDFRSYTQQCITASLQKIQSIIVARNIDSDQNENRD